MEMLCAADTDRVGSVTGGSRLHHHLAAPWTLGELLPPFKAPQTDTLPLKKTSRVGLKNPRAGARSPSSRLIFWDPHRSYFETFLWIAACIGAAPGAVALQQGQQ